MTEAVMNWVGDISQRIFLGALWPLWQFATEGKARFFWVYCVTGLIIAAYAYRKHKDAESFKATLLDKDVWASQSAINDYIMIALVPVLKLTILSGLVLNGKAVTAFVVATLHAWGVSGEASDGATVPLGILLTLSLFVVDDVLRWWTHYQFHRIPELWEFHKVHHSAEELNFATADRVHPIEALIEGATFVFGAALVNGLFIALFGDKLTVTTVAGANVFLFVFNIFGGVLRHSPFWVSFGPRIERWLISPAMHQIHHSNKQEHFDRNFGGALAIWDRMAGTLHIPKGREIEGFGIGEETKDFRSLDVIMFRPFASAWQLLQKRLGRDEAVASEKIPATL